MNSTYPFWYRPMACMCVSELCYSVGSVHVFLVLLRLPSLYTVHAASLQPLCVSERHRGMERRALEPLHSCSVGCVDTCQLHVAPWYTDQGRAVHQHHWLACVGQDVPGYDCILDQAISH
jgi:hypothetical protein